jgi:sialidase-1
MAPNSRQTGPVMKRFLARLMCALACSSCSGVEAEDAETLTDAGPRDGSFDAALAFDGIDDYASTGSARFPHVKRPQTQMLWLKPALGGSGRQCLLALRLRTTSGTILALDSGVPVALSVLGPRDLVRAPEPLQAADWHHLAYVLDEAGSALYVDGKLVGKGPVPATNRTPTLGFIGSMDGSVDAFRGEIDEVRIYDRALSEAEVAAAAAGEPESAEQLVLYLPFNELAGARSYDRSGLGNHAALGDGIPNFMPQRVPSGARQRPANAGP